MPVTVTPSLLFKTAALINAISVPGHIMFGLDAVEPALNSISIAHRKSRVGQAGLRASWNYLNGSIIILAILNWQWATSGGPKTTSEKAILLTTIVNGLIDGLTYFKAGEYAPLSLMWGGPALSAAGYLLGQ